MQFRFGTAVGAMGAGLNAARWMHKTSPEAWFQTKFGLVMCPVSVVPGLLRFSTSATGTTISLKKWTIVAY